MKIDTITRSKQSFTKICLVEKGFRKTSSFSVSPPKFTFCRFGMFRKEFNHGGYITNQGGPFPLEMTKTHVVYIPPQFRGGREFQFFNKEYVDSLIVVRLKILGQV